MKISTKRGFNHGTRLLSDGLNIEESRFDQLNEIAKDTVLRAFFFDMEMNDKLKMLEFAINEAAPKGEIEAMILGYMIGRGEAQAHEIHKQMQLEE